MQAGAKELSDLIPESTLRTNFSSGVRLPPLRAGTCWSPRGIFLWEDNQGGTANCMFVPEANKASGFFHTPGTGKGVIAL